MKIDYAKGDGLVPAIVQDADTRAVLMLGYMNAEALSKTRESGLVTFYSRSKGRLWTKGETSGHHLQFVSVHNDCDADALLVLARPTGPVCHTGNATCFATSNEPHVGFLTELEQIVRARKANPVAGSYTSSLFEKGIKKIAQKVGEEGVEVALEGLTGDTDRLREESADLLYHLLVLLVESDTSIQDVLTTLKQRNR